jgi:spore germination protein YaaH
MIASLIFFATASKPEVSAWVVGYNPISIQRFQERAKQLDTVFMEYYTVTPSGMPVRRVRYDKTFALAREIAKRNRVEFYGMINNYSDGEGTDGFEPTRMTKAVATAESRAAHVAELVKMLKQDGAQGVDLDFESMKGDDRDRYSAFVALLAKALKRESMKLSVTVHPKQEVIGGWDAVKAQDYKALGAVADRFNVMTYDFSWSTGPEGAIAPNDWVERVITFAATQVPANKIGVGIACYGYDWSKSPATSLTWPDFNAKEAKIDPPSGELINGKAHFSGAEAFRQKYQIATKLGIKSVAFWYCGSEDPAIWSFLPTRR